MGEMKLAIALLATKCDCHTLADKFRVSKSSAIRWINKVCVIL